MSDLPHTRAKKKPGFARLLTLEIGGGYCVAASVRMRPKKPDPCNGGYLGHYSGRCHCTPDQIARYRARISGPLLDRIDPHIEVPGLAEADLMAGPQGESSKAVRERVAGAREIQLRRQGVPNAQLAGREIEERARTEIARLSELPVILGIR